MQHRFDKLPNMPIYGGIEVIVLCHYTKIIIILELLEIFYIKIKAPLF